MQIILGDCLEELSKISNDSVNLVVIDPPYFNVCYEDWDNFQNKEEYLSWCYKWTEESFRVLKEGGSFYCFGGIGSKNKFIFWEYVMKIAEKYTFCSYINWKRFRPKGYKGKHNNWGDCREDIAYFCKGKEPKVFHKQFLNEAGLSAASQKRYKETGVGLVCGNIWVDIPEAQLNGGMNRTLSHPSEKPVKLMERIIAASSDEGDLVVDFFAGSGTTGIVCQNLKREFILVEKEEKYYQMILNRLSVKN